MLRDRTRQLHLDTDEIVDIVNLFDGEGSETDDIEQAACCTAQLPDGRWLTVNMRRFERVTIH